MSFANPAIEREYKYYLKQLPDLPNLFHTPTSISPSEVLKAHFLICDYFVNEGEGIGGFGPRDVNLLVSSVLRQFTGFGGKQKWDSEYLSCASLFYGLIKNHPFYDANKRTAFLTILFKLDKMGRVITSSYDKWEELTTRTADDKLPDYSQFKKFRKDPDSEIRFISWFLKKNTRQRNKRKYVLTYHQFDKLLRNYGFFLDNPSGNYIYVYKIEKRKRWLGKTAETVKRIMKIGFPGWTREISKNEIQNVLRECKLTDEYGIDSDAFYGRAEPLPSLIPTYHGIFIRLRDK